MVAPMKFLNKTMGKKVSLLLKDGRVLEGKLSGYDDYLNLTLDETAETHEDLQRRLGTVIVRGNTVVSISLA